MERDPNTQVRVDLDPRGMWSVAVPERSEPISCYSLPDARRVAYRHAARRRPCELVVRDAYHRVLAREFLAE